MVYCTSFCLGFDFMEGTMIAGILSVDLPEGVGSDFGGVTDAD